MNSHFSAMAEREGLTKQLAREKKSVALLPASKARLQVMQLLEIRTEQRLWKEF